MILKRSTILHLRIPFSFFLLPVFLFGWAVVAEANWQNVILVFAILHLLLYPASNGYNSYFDKDEGSIGGLKNPPRVSKELYFTAIVFDGIALALGFLLSWKFVIMLFIYGLASKAYSHPIVRLKKMPIIGWLTAGFFQGYFTFLMVVEGLVGIESQDYLVTLQFPAIICLLIFLGSYPMTQIYQHEEDRKRGDITLSLLLGVLGTFHLTAIFFTVAMVTLGYFILTASEIVDVILMMVILTPVLAFFGWWYFKVRVDINQTNFDNTMKLNFISSLCLNLFFCYLIIIS